MQPAAILAPRNPKKPDRAKNWRVHLKYYRNPVWNDFVEIPGPAFNLEAPMRILHLAAVVVFSIGMSVLSHAQSPGTKAVNVLMGDSEMLGFDNFKDVFPPGTVNLSIGGATSTQAISPLPTAIGYKPKSIIVFMGLPDVMQGTDPAVLGKNYASLFSDVQKESSGTTVYALAVLPGNMPSQVALYNDSIKRAVSSSPNAVFLDFTASFAGQGGSINPEYNIDNAHLNEKGYQLLGQLLKPYL
jgi:hypothetical protein